MQRAAGVNNITDISNLLNTAPRAVVELLRITAVVRSVTGPLGASRAERLRLNGSYALRGLPGLSPGYVPGSNAGAAAAAGDDAASASGEGGGGRGNALAYRIKVESRLAVIGGYCFAQTMLMRVLLATLHVFGQNVPLG
jgi:hypothetical protein